MQEKLRSRGLKVDVSTEYAPALDGYDLVHLFTLHRPTEGLVRALHVKKHGLPLVFSPIYLDTREYDEEGRYGLARLAYRIIRDRKRVEMIKDWVFAAKDPHSWRHYWEMRRFNLDEQRRKLIGLADGFVTIAQLEIDALKKDYGARGPHRVAHYGVSEIFFTASPKPFLDRYGVSNFVICAGVISSLKNQLRLTEALRDTGITLLLVGHKLWMHRAYYRQVRRAVLRGNPRIVLFPAVSQVELASMFAASKVVVLPSWFETCGLACLEGAACGANVVITNRGYTREYFGDFAWYCDPSDISSIRQAVLSAYEAPRHTDFAAYIRQHYTWERAAESAIELYHEVLRTRRVGPSGERVLGSPLTGGV
jgi:glycosyltransferase involved in cell wall biosynthesis